MSNPQKQTKKVAIWAASVLTVAIVVLAVVFYFTKDEDNSGTSLEKAIRVLDKMPIIDGHNDFPFNLRLYVHNDLRLVNFSSDLTQVEPWASEDNSHTDIPRLKKGRVGAQFWVAYTRCTTQYKDSVEQTLEQIDVIKRLVEEYSYDLQWATSANDIENAISNGKIASLIGVEGGHSIQSSLAILRILYDQGTRYMTLTHSCNTPWADSSPVDGNQLEPQSQGLTEFGKKVIDEMNRLGMMIDLSHVSADTMRSALIKSKAPVIFSHSSSRTLCNTHRNVPDDVLDLVKETNSLVMVNFYSRFVQCDPNKNATIDDVVAHINYIKNWTSADNVGIGADYDGVSQVPEGLEDVSKYPDLFAKLIESGAWTDEDLEKLAGRNLLRVFRAVEKLRDDLKSQPPHQDSITESELAKHTNKSCITADFPASSPVLRSTFSEAESSDTH